MYRLKQEANRDLILGSFLPPEWRALVKYRRVVVRGRRVRDWVSRDRNKTVQNAMDKMI
jgi:hypothetical protein